MKRASDQANTSLRRPAPSRAFLNDHKATRRFDPYRRFFRPVMPTDQDILESLNHGEVLTVGGFMARPDFVANREERSGCGCTHSRTQTSTSKHLARLSGFRDLLAPFLIDSDGRYPNAVKTPSSPRSGREDGPLAVPGNRHGQAHGALAAPDRDQRG